MSSSIKKMNKEQKFKYKRHLYNKRNDKLEVNLKGFLCTCNNREKDCVKEAYNLLNKYADLLCPIEEEMFSSNEEKDAGEELKNELSQLRNCKTEAKRFRLVDSGAKNILFLTTTLKDPTQLVKKIFSDIEMTKIQQTKFLIRLIPIEVTCKAYVKDIQNAFKPLGDKYFLEKPVTFSVVYNHRNNNDLKKDDVVKVVADMVINLRSDHKVNLKQPEICVVIEVIRKIALIGVVPDYVKYKKCNLVAVSGQYGLDDDNKLENHQAE